MIEKNLADGYETVGHCLFEFLVCLVRVAGVENNAVFVVRVIVCGHYGAVWIDACSTRNCVGICCIIIAVIVSIRFARCDCDVGDSSIV